jgi:beta-glucosidase
MTFAYDELRMSAQEIEPGDELQVSIDVINKGNRVGKEVVKIYLRDIASRLQRPNKELKAEASVKLEPGERKTVTLTIGWEALAHEWVAEAREFEVLVGASSQDIRATSTFTLTTTSRFGGFREHENVST